MLQKKYDMKGYLIYPATTPRKNNAFSWFQDAAAHHGIELEVYFYEHPGVSSELSHLPLPDFVFMRGYNTELSSWYERQGIRVINTTESMKLCRDKFATNEVLERRGIPVPRTIAEAPGDSYESVLKSLYSNVPEHSGFDTAQSSHKEERTCFILKQCYGSKGENVYLVGSQKEFDDAVAQCKATERQRLDLMGKDSELGIDAEEIKAGCRLIYQEYISFSRGRDIRVWVFAGKVIGNILRYNDNSFKSNFAQGGSFKDIELPAEAAKIASSAALALGLDFAGVDLLFDRDDKFRVCEVNGNPGFRTASVDIPERIFSSIY